MTEHRSKTQPANPKFGLWIWVITLVVNLAAGGIVAYEILGHRQRSIDEAVMQTQNHSRVLDVALAGHIRLIDNTLQAVGDKVEHDHVHAESDRASLALFLKQQYGRIAETLGIRVTDERGITRVAVGNVQDPHVDVSKNQYFIRQRDSRDTGLVIDEPSVGSVSGQWGITLSRRLSKPDGSFAGIVFISIPTDYLVRTLARLDLGPKGNSGLWSRTTLIARHARDDPAGARTGATTPSPQLRGLLESGKKTATYQARSGIDGIVRVYQFQQVGDFPLYTVVGLAEQDYLADWQENARHLAFLLAGLMVGTSLLAVFAGRAWRRYGVVQGLLSENEERYRTVADFNYGWEYWRGPQRELLYISPSCERITGYTPAQFMEDPELIERIIHVDDREHMANHLVGYQDDHDHSLDFRIVRKDGRIAWVSHGCRPVFSSDGEFRGRRVSNQDISDIKAAERLLLEEKNRFHDFSESSADWFWETDADSRFIYFSNNFDTIFGFGSELLLGKTRQEFLAKDLLNPPELIAAHLALLKENRPFRDFEYRILDAAGAVCWLSVSGVPVTGEDGSFAGYRGIGKIITGRKEMEAALEEHRQGLEKLVNERTRELSRAKDAAEAANVAKTAFLANMSHEMRTPVHQISGIASMIRRDPLTPKQVDRMQMLDTACHRLTGIIDAILNLTNLEAKRFDLVDQPVDLPALVDEVVATIRPQAEAKQLLLIAEAAPDLAKLRGDASHIKLALLNYLTNAIRFTTAGCVTLRTRQVEADDSSALIRFEVEDTGIGIAPEDQGRLFNIFEQVDNSSTRQFGGLGTGLAMTKKIANFMGGDAGCESRLGEGSLFWFTVRLNKG